MNFFVQTTVVVLLALVACQNSPGPATAPAPAAYAATDTLAPALVPPPVGRDYLMGKFDPAPRADFVKVGRPYTDKPAMLLRREAFEAFQKMWEAARRDGVTLKIISSTRTFEQQKAIWNGKWTRFAVDTPDPEARARRILEYSAMPGASRHHWGTDLDLNDLNDAAFLPGGPYEKVYQWLKNHAHEYGFCQPYTAKNEGRRTGYNEEKWHWSYHPLSKPLLDEYLRTMNDSLLTGFEGAAMALKINVVDNYAAGIDRACQ